MPSLRRLLAVGLLVAGWTLSVSAEEEPSRQHRNLQVLSPEISRDELSRVMLEKHPDHDMARRRLATLRGRL
jgi:hypothetical protein